MKKIFFYLLLATAILSAPMVATANIIGFYGTNGSGSRNLDSYPTANITANMIAIGYDNTDQVFRVYVYDSTSSDAESIPDIIKPDDNSGNGRWILQDTVKEDELDASGLLAQIKTVDGAGSGLDADLLGGTSSGDFATESEVPGLIGSITNHSDVSTTAPTDGQVLKYIASTGLYTPSDVGSGSGDVTAAADFTADNRLIRSDGTGKAVQDSGITIDDSDNMSGIESISVNRSATPMFTLGDSDCVDNDDNFKLFINATDTGSGTEDIDVTMQAQVNGTLADIISADASAGSVIFGSSSFKAGGIMIISEVSANTTLTAAQCSGGIIYATAAVTITLPAVFDGASVTIIADGANTVTVAPNASDAIKIDGAWKADGASIASGGTDGAMVTLIYRSSQGWFAAEDGDWS